MTGAEIENLDRTFAQLTYAASTIVSIVLAAFLLAFILRYLWNTTMPQIFSLKEISFWQSMRLLLIAIILFGGLLR